MKKQPLVSVGIPTYNRPEGLHRTLECITGQTYKNLKIIVSDNCSPGPETEAIVREFMVKDSRIQYFRQEKNRGLEFNFKFVLEKATGEYFMLAADDDMWEPSYISKLINIMESDKSIVLAFSDFDNIDEDGKQIRVYPKILKLSSSETIFKRLFKFIMFEESDGKANLIHGIMRLNRLKEIGGFNKTLGEFAADDLFLFSMLFKGNFYIFDELLFHKRRSLVCDERRSLWVKISRWHTYFLGYHRIVATSKLDSFLKIALHFVTIFREVQFPMRWLYLRCLRK